MIERDTALLFWIWIWLIWKWPKLRFREIRVANKNVLILSKTFVKTKFKCMTQFLFFQRISWNQSYKWICSYFWHISLSQSCKKKIVVYSKNFVKSKLQSNTVSFFTWKQLSFSNFTNFFRKKVSIFYFNFRENTSEWNTGKLYFHKFFLEDNFEESMKM